MAWVLWDTITLGDSIPVDKLRFVSQLCSFGPVLSSGCFLATTLPASLETSSRLSIRPYIFYVADLPWAFLSHHTNSQTSLLLQEHRPQLKGYINPLYHATWKGYSTLLAYNPSIVAPVLPSSGESPIEVFGASEMLDLCWWLDLEKNYEVMWSYLSSSLRLRRM